MHDDVYLRTRDALATLVSERAATRVLDVALRRAHLERDGLDARSVRHLLLGPVQRELEGILPRTGLRRTMRRLARQVADEIGSPRGADARSSVATSHEPTSSPLQPVTQSSVYLPDVAPPLPGTATPTPRATASEAGPVHRSAPDPAAGAGVVTAERRATAAVNRRHAQERPTVVPHPLPAEALDTMAVRFAEIDGVRQVIGLRAVDGPQVRGEGIDADAVAPLAQSALRLLGRFGPLRSLVVEHDAGLLFVFPLGRDAIAVLARSNVNMGAVFAARAALEEGP